MPDGCEDYDVGTRLLLARRFQEAVPFFAEALRQQETCERWNDWATACCLSGRPLEAERGYRSALTLDPEDAQATANLGAVLVGQKRLTEGMPLLEKSLPRLDEPQRASIRELLGQCQRSVQRSGQNPVTSPASGPVSSQVESSASKAQPLAGDAPLYFFHIPKTSGVSFHHFLVSMFGEGSVSPPLIWDALPADLGAVKNWKVWTGHFGGLLPFVLGSWPRMVTILRNPVDRTISHINHVRRASDHPLHRYAQGLDVLGYCRHHRLLRTVDNYQARYLASLSFALSILKTVRHPIRATSALAFEDALFSLDAQFDLLDWALRALSEMEMVGIAEAHLQTLRLFSHRFNGPTVTASSNENKAGEGQLRRPDLSSEELECIQEMTQIDQVVYDCARKRFERECRQANIGDEPQ
jgi:tetratricopeptide (TPR) repeat protein